VSLKAVVIRSKTTGERENCFGGKVSRKYQLSRTYANRHGWTSLQEKDTDINLSFLLEGTDLMQTTKDQKCQTKYIILEINFKIFIELQSIDTTL